LKGESFARVDLRVSSKSGLAYILEVNSTPGLGPETTNEILLN